MGFAKHELIQLQTSARRHESCSNCINKCLGKPILSIHSIKLPGVKKSVIWHECDENSVKTPLGCKKPFTSSCHQDVNGFLHPGGVFLYYIDFTSFFVVTNF